MAKTTKDGREGERGAAKEPKRAIAQAASKVPTKTADAAGEDAPARPRVGPGKFLQQVRQEASKVTWPTRQETTVTTIMVFIMISVMMVFFFLVDWLLGSAVRWFLGLTG